MQTITEILVAWREIADTRDDDRDGDFDPYSEAVAETLRACAEEIEAALKAAPQPVVASITSTTGVRFNVRILRSGDRYGLDDVLTWEDLRPGVEFYDSRYNHTRFGQFVSRYYVETLMEGRGPSGLDLHGGIAAWKIDAAAMQIVRSWLHHETGITGS